MHYLSGQPQVPITGKETVFFSRKENETKSAFRRIRPSIKSASTEINCNPIFPDE